MLALNPWLLRYGKRLCRQSSALRPGSGPDVRAVEALRVDFVDVLRPRRTCREPSRLGHDLETANGCAVARRSGEDGLDWLAGKVGGLHLLRRQLLQLVLLLRRSLCLDPIVERLAELARQFAVDLTRIATRRAVISADSNAGTMPSLSVVQTLPSLRLNDAPALSSPPKPSDPSSKPGTNHLKPTGLAKLAAQLCR